MKKFVVLLVLFCALIFSSISSAQVQPVQLYDQNVFTLTQKLQDSGIKIWKIEYKQTREGYPGYEANFGDNPNNKLALLVNNDGSIAALGIITQFETFDHPIYPTLCNKFEKQKLIDVDLYASIIDIAERERSYPT